jgi:hypothetical protein
VRHLPLSLESVVRVSYVEVWEHSASGPLLYHHSWITDLDVDAANGAVVVQIGRSRWKIENEQCNVHKTHGYELTHNYGPGQQPLAMVFYLLNLLAYVTHGVLALGDRLSPPTPLREVAPGVRERVARTGERVPGGEVATLVTDLPRRGRR